MAMTVRVAALLTGVCLISACSSRSVSDPGPLPPPDTAATAAPGGAAPAVQAPAIVSGGPATTVKGKAPVQLYSEIARQVRACWFRPAKPALRGYVFRGEAGAGGKSGKQTNIEIHEQTPDLKRGLMAFKIEFEPLRDGTRVVVQNLKLPETQGQKFTRDVSYWAQGGPNCDAP